MENNSVQNYNFAQYLKEQLNIQKLTDLQQQATHENLSLIRYLLEKHLFPDNKIAEVLAKYFGINFLDLSAINPEEIPTHLLKEPLLRQHNILPFKETSEF